MDLQVWRIAIGTLVFTLSACSSDSNSSVSTVETVSFSGSADDQARTCNAIAQTAPDQTNVKYVGNIWREEVDTDAQFPALWNQVTAENAGKWGEVETVQDNMQWQRLDTATMYAANNAMLYKHHTLIWGASQPTWLSGLTSNEQRNEIEQWIDLVAERFPSMEQVDVVNEPLHSVPSYVRALELMGPSIPSQWSWVSNTFAKARTSFPNSELLLNDFNVLHNDRNTDEYLEIIWQLQADDLIDAIGVQSHFLENKDDDKINRNLNRLGATGLPVYVSEFDLNIEDDQQQLERMQRLFPMFYTSPYVYGITFWGFRENQIWRPHSHLISADGTKRPALKWLECYLAL